MTIEMNVVTKRGILQDYFNKLMVAGFYARILLNPSSSHPRQIDRAIERLPQSLAAIPTYSDYLETIPQNVLDAIEKRFGSRVEADIKLLDSIVEKLHTYANRKPDSATAKLVDEVMDIGTEVLYEE